MRKNMFLLLFVLVLMALPLASAADGEDSIILTLSNGTIPDASDTTLNFVNQNPDPVEPGSYVELRWKVENFGGIKTDDLIFEIIPDYPFSLDPGTNAVQMLGKLESYQIGKNAYILYYKLKVDQAALEGPTKLRLKYSVDGGSSWTTATYYVRIQERSFVVLVDSVSSTPEVVSPGSEASIKMTLQNMASSDIKNVKVELGLERVDTTAASVVRTDLPFAPVGSSDEDVFLVIRPNEVKDVEFKISVDTNAESKVHKLPVTVTYQNNEGTTFTKEFLIGIKVFDKPDYLINLEEKDIYMNNNKGKFVISISNRGFSKINFLTVKLLGSGDYKILSPDIVYLGNLDSDDFESAEFEIYMSTDKSEVQMPLEITYKDNYNNEYKDSRAVKLELYSNGDAVKYGYQPAQNKTNLFIMIAILIISTVFWLFMIAHAINSKDTKYHKTIWIVMIILTYVLGALVYYIFGRKKQHD